MGKRVLSCQLLSTNQMPFVHVHFHVLVYCWYIQEMAITKANAITAPVSYSILPMLVKKGDFFYIKLTKIDTKMQPTRQEI